MNPDLLLSPAEFCRKYDAWEEAGAFAIEYDTMAEVWDNCQDLQMLIWIIDSLTIKIDKKDAVKFACWCVRNTPIPGGKTTWDLLTDERSRQAVEAAERFVEGEACDRSLATSAADAATAVAASAAADAAFARSTSAAAAANTAYANLAIAEVHSAASAAYYDACSDDATSASEVCYTVSASCRTAAIYCTWISDDATTPANVAHTGALREIIKNPFKELN